MIALLVTLHNAALAIIEHLVGRSLIRCVFLAQRNRLVHTISHLEYTEMIAIGNAVMAITGWQVIRMAHAMRALRLIAISQASIEVLAEKTMTHLA